ncbi:pyridoxamine 5'-phosphate oxidase family protein [Phyllobacterium pellucidum]|uniref:pyridoxamine 5'-phosphate oxidase family protein n=1 Tax=Phyllobacterium pellucidum TaxID=2740464 RepID=UPI001D15824B|nr:pyridoxamine 5'-phosphate oxidase family protein [Phyllobacterium sp. T1018]UGY09070.1 pyridoxamine 5'-phosphate oxidase family protein [Phyllobacterium sp. T1018]
MSRITSIEQLEAIYSGVAEASTAKVTDRITPEYRRLIEGSPFVALATSGPEGLDCSPRGDLAGFVRIHDHSTLMIPDRRGNNRVDSLRNIVRHPRVALLFLIPGVNTTFRVNGRAFLDTDRALLDSFAVEEKTPRSVMVVEVEEAYFQCARALIRSELWNPNNHRSPKEFPTPGQVLAALSEDRVGGEAYDHEWPQRAAKTMW